jgi:hypothetical protein
VYRLESIKELIETLEKSGDPLYETDAGYYVGVSGARGNDVSRKTSSVKENGL